ncbi:transposase [Vreelandella populi]
MIGSTSVRDPVLLLESVKRRSKEPLDPGFGRSRSGLTIKARPVCDRHGWPLSFILSPSQQTDDSRYFISTLERVYLRGSIGRPHTRSRYVVADKSYDSNELRHYCDRHGMKPVIARRNMRRRTRPELPRRFDKHKYR